MFGLGLGPSGCKEQGDSNTRVIPVMGDDRAGAARVIAMVRACGGRCRAGAAQGPAGHYWGREGLGRVTVGP